MKFGLLSALIGLFISVFIFLLSRGEGWIFLLPCATLSSFVVGLFLWSLLYPSDGSTSRTRGILIGISTGILSHPLAWYLLILTNWLRGQSFPAAQPMNPIQGVIGAVVLSFWSLFLIGWLTVSTNALVGWFVARNSE